MKNGRFWALILVLCLTLGMTDINAAETETVLDMRDAFSYGGEPSQGMAAYSTEGAASHLSGISAPAAAMYEYCKAYFEPSNITTGSVTAQVDGENVQIELNQIVVPCDVAEFGLSADDKAAVYAALREVLLIIQLDRPDLHWLSYELDAVRTVGGRVSAVIFYTAICGGRDTGIYQNLTKAEVMDNIALVNAWRDALLSEAAVYPNSYLKQKFFNDRLCDTIDYDADDYDESYNLLGAAKGKAACEGYAKALCSLMEGIGEDCVIVTGKASSGGAHAWNGVLMEDGNWYQTDITWNDHTGIRTAYFLAGESIMLNKHSYDDYTGYLGIGFSERSYVYTETTAEATTETTIITETSTEMATETTIPTEASTEVTTETTIPTEASTEMTTETTILTETSTEVTTETTMPTEASTRTFIFGGACAESRLSAADSAMLLQKVLNSSFKTTLEYYTDDHLYYLDVDRSGRIDAADAAAVLQKVLNSAYIMPAEEKG